MSVIQQFRDKVAGYEGYAQAFIVSKQTALITHGVASAIGLIVGILIGHKF